jgi:hypothetical protein
MAEKKESGKISRGKLGAKMNQIGNSRDEIGSKSWMDQENFEMNWEKKTGKS